MLYLKKIQFVLNNETVDTFTVCAEDYFKKVVANCSYVTCQYNNMTLCFIAPFSSGVNNKYQIQLVSPTSPYIQTVQYTRYYDQNDATNYFKYDTNFQHIAKQIGNSMVVGQSFYNLRGNGGKIEVLYNDNCNNLCEWKTAKFVDFFNNNTSSENIGLSNENIGSTMMFIDSSKDVIMKFNRAYDEGTTITLSNLTICDSPPYIGDYILSEEEQIFTKQNTIYSFLRMYLKIKYNYTLNNNILLAQVGKQFGDDVLVKAYEIVLQDLKPTNYSTSEYVKIVETTTDSKILYNVNKNESQKFNLIDCLNLVCLNPIYSSSEFQKQNMYDNSNITNNYSNKNYLAPIGTINNIIHIGTNAFGVMKNTKQGFKYYDDIFNQYITQYPQVSLYNCNMNIWLNCDNLKQSNLICQNLNRGISENQYIVPDRLKIEGIPFNIGLDLPLILNYYDYNKGALWNDAYTFNNELTYKYDTDISLYKPLPTYTYNLIALNNVREYDKIRINNRTIWASYNSNQRYSMQESEGFGKTGFVYNQPYPNILNFEDVVQTIKVGFECTLTYGCSIPYFCGASCGYGYDIYKYQQLEKVHSVNRPFTYNSHKSNVYSLELVNTGLNENLTDSNLKLQIQKSIERVIREYLKEVTPAHTNLWKIIWKGI